MLSRRCNELEAEQEDLINRVKSLESELASVKAEKSQEESLNYLVMSEYFDEEEESSQLEDSDNAESSDVVTSADVNEGESKKIDSLMAKIVTLQDQLKEKNKEISNLKSNLAAQENLSKTYFNEIENLTTQLNAKEADLARSTDVMDLFIQQQRESVANDSMSLQSDEEVVREATDDAVRYNTAQQEHNSVLENRGGEPMNGDVVTVSHACPLFFRFGDEVCPGPDTCGRSHTVAQKSYRKKGYAPKILKAKVHVQGMTNVGFLMIPHLN